VAEWVDLIDPTEEELRKHLPANTHAVALGVLLQPPVHDDEPRPRIVSHGDYVFGVLLVPVVVKKESRLYYQEVDFIATRDELITVSKSQEGEQPFDPKPAKEACRADETVGMYLYHLVDEVAERYLDLVDDLDDEVDDLEDLVASRPVSFVASRLRKLRAGLRSVRRTLAPTRDAVHKVIDDRVELDGAELFPRDVEIAFGDAYEKLLRAFEALESTRDALGGVRDYLQGKVAVDQNEVMKRLTITASLLLVPTFIVGLYGQNFVNIPELHWGFGYWWSWGWIIATTIAQLVFYRWKRWL
jgi:magnesium transporter